MGLLLTLLFQNRHTLSEKVGGRAVVA